MMTKENRLVLGFILFIVGFFDINPSKVIDFINSKVVKPTPVIVIDKPSDSLIALTKPVADVILDKQDKKHFAVFFNEFSSRKYENVTMQNINDILTIAVKEYFGDTVKGKYTTLADNLVKLLSVQAVQSADSKLTNTELKEISDRLKALAWNLTQ